MCGAYSKCQYCWTDRDVCGELQDFQGDCSGFKCTCPPVFCKTNECYSMEEYRNKLLPQRQANVIKTLPLAKHYFDVE